MNTTSTSTHWRLTYQYWLLIVGGLALLILSFWGGLQELFIRWDKQEEYSHGYMIPLVTLYFIWLKKDEIQQTKFEPSWMGFIAIVFALLLYLVGEISALFILIHYAFISILISLAWTVMGWQALRLILVPLLLLVFAIPLPYFLEAGLTAQLQLFSSKLGVDFIRLCNIPVFLEGNIIDLGSYQLQVVEACSGLRYLFPLLSLGVICAYMYQTALWKRVVVILSTIPITLFMNSFRIGVIGVLVDRWGRAAAEGFLHDFEGWIVFMACFGILFIEMALLLKVGKEKETLANVFNVSYYEPTKPSNISQREISKPYVFSLLLLLISLVLVSSLDEREEVVPVRQRFVTFPMQLADWKGKSQSMSNDVIKTLKLDDYILADYVKEGEGIVNFYAAFYNSQRKGASPHSPKVCIPGGGWEIASLDRTSFSNGYPFNRLLIRKGNQQQLVYYWFQQRGRHIANEYLMKWYLFKDALLLNRTDGALVRLTTIIGRQESLAAADARLNSFAGMLMPYLNDYIPE